MGEKKAKYLELVEWLEDGIRSGSLKPGDKIPSENKLCEQFSMSRQTVRHAIHELVQSGILSSIRGSGTYVSGNPQDRAVDCNRVAVVMTYLDGYIFPRTIQAIENALFKEGFTIQIAFTNNMIGRERMILEDILQKNEVAGIILEATKSALPNPNLHYFRELKRRNIPTLFMNSFYKELEAPHVSINDKKAGYLATRCLLDHGHTKITGVFKCDDGQGPLRYQGFMEALTEAGIAMNESQVLWIDTQDIKNLDKITLKMKERFDGCTGVVCYNDEVAFELMNVLDKEGIRIPEDLSIVGIDDSELSVLGKVKLSSVPYPMEKLGTKAAENVLAMIRNPYFDATYEFDVYSVERDSVKDI